MSALILAFAVGAGLRAHAASGQHGEPSNGTVAIGYEPDRQTAAARTSVGLGPADSTSIAVLTSTTTGELAVFGKPNLRIDGVFTVAAQTCVVSVLFCYKDSAGTIKNTWWSTPTTLTASALPGPANTGFATAPGFVYDTGGATHARLVCTTLPGSGTVDFYAGTH